MKHAHNSCNIKYLILIATYLTTFLVIYLTFSSSYAKEMSQAPEFTHHSEEEWINSKPLKLKELKGKVVLLDFWTFECWNCYRSFPWLNALEKKFKGQDFQVIGIHSPEFKHEHDKKRVIAKVKEFGLHHPVMMDNDFSYWKALNNRYWPAFYLIDKQGVIQGKYIGETHEGKGNALVIEAKIEQLLGK